MFHENNLPWYFGGVGLGKAPRKNTRVVLKQITRPLPTEIDDEPELIDLSTSFASTRDEDLLRLNERVIVEQPIKWWINGSGGSFKQYKDGRLEGQNKGIGKYHPLCVEFPRDTSRLWRSIIGERVTPTRIISLLTQNLNDTPRPASTFLWWKQPDEGYYIAKAKEGLAEFIAETRENYYLVNENSKHRLKFRCPKMGKRDKGHGRLGDCDDGYVDDVDFNKYGISWMNYPLMDIGPILIHVDPDSDQARWICPRCSKENSKKYRGDGKAIKHNVPRALRDALAKDGILPPKEYKYKDRLSEAPKLLNLITKNPGMSFYELDHAMEWNSDGKNSERIIMKHLKDKVNLRRGRKGHKGYKVYIKH